MLLLHEATRETARTPDGECHSDGELHRRALEAKEGAERTEGEGGGEEKESEAGEEGEGRVESGGAEEEGLRRGEELQGVEG